MWIARNRNGNLMLHPFSKPTYNENTGKWSQGRGWHSCVIPNIYPDLKCEDEPIEVSLIPSMLCSVQEKLAEAVVSYFEYTGELPFDEKESSRRYNNMAQRGQDWSDVKYDDPNTWDLYFDDYVGNKR